MMTDKDPAFECHAIGVAHTPFPWPGPNESTGIPAQGAPGVIEIFPEYEAGLLDIESTTHIIVLPYFDKADRSCLQVMPRKCSTDTHLRGVFAIRAPVRPNPIALTITKLDKRENRFLHVRRLDFLDGTPILDIKPYTPGWDMIPSARQQYRTPLHQMKKDSLQARIERELENACDDPGELGAQVLAKLLELIETGRDPHEGAITYKLPKLDARVEMLQCAASATFGNGRLCYDPSAQSPFEAIF